jgi:hypothetical protein
LLPQKKHIALIGLGLFVFPIIFQSGHIVWHHSLEHSEKAGHSCCSEAHTCFSDGLAQVRSDAEPCILCEFDSFINTVPLSGQFNIRVPFFTLSFFIPSANSAFQNKTALKFPRAPPISSNLHFTLER